MILARSFPDFFKFYRCLQRLYALEREFRSTVTRADEIGGEYKRELLKGLNLAEEFLPRLCTPAGKRVASALLKFVDSKGGEVVGQSFDLSDAITAFRVIVDLSNRADAKVFPISGTLLGLVREGGLLTHDYDLDFGIMEEDRLGYWGLIEGLESHSEVSSIQHSWPEPLTIYVNPELRHATGIPPKTKIQFHSGVSIDLVSHFLYKAKRLHASEVNMWQHDDFNLTGGRLLGVDTYIPEVPEKYLEENYGDWRTPVTDYVYFLDTPNWSPVLSAMSVRFYAGNGLRFAAKEQTNRVMRIVKECIPTLTAKELLHE